MELIRVRIEEPPGQGRSAYRHPDWIESGGMRGRPGAGPRGSVRPGDDSAARGGDEGDDGVTTAARSRHPLSPVPAAGYVGVTRVTTPLTLFTSLKNGGWARGRAVGSSHPLRRGRENGPAESSPSSPLTYLLARSEGVEGDGRPAGFVLGRQPFHSGVVTPQNNRPG